jgi:hypothetical protein
MNRFLIVVILSLNYFVTGNAQTAYPQTYFSSPTKHPIKLAGTFGELRSNHFHAGIDIKSSKGVEGDPIIAVADGFVSRIGVKPTGYGNALYIDHPNGYTSVYGHLQKFDPDIANYVKQKQYEAKKFHVDFSPPVDSFYFKKGDIIGYMGNTGSSGGAHLHFEIRDTKSEVPINPLLFGYEVADNRKPFLRGLKAYFLDDKNEAYQSQKIAIKKQKDASYKVRGDTVKIGAWRTALSIYSMDQLNGAPNRNGVFAMYLYVDDTLKFHFTMEAIGFHESKYLNAHLDYAHYKKSKGKYTRLFKLPNNQLSIYDPNYQNGIIKLFQSKPRKVNIKCLDLKGNEQDLEFYLLRDKDMQIPKTKTHNYLLFCNEENKIETPDLKVYFPKDAFYNDLYLDYEVLDENTNYTYSKTHILDGDSIPVHKPYDIQIKAEYIPDSLKSKAFIAICNGKNIAYAGGKWEGNFLKSKAYSLGKYAIMLDQTSPTITPYKNAKKTAVKDKITFKIEDDYSISSYNGYINGEWILMEYDAKKDKLFHVFEKEMAKGDFEFKIEVKDGRGNIGVFEKVYRLQ